jgi:hypothetical protein
VPEGKARKSGNAPGDFESELIVFQAKPGCHPSKVIGGM